MDETRYLLSSPINAKLLRKGIAELNAGKFIEHDIAVVKKKRRRVATKKRRSGRHGRP